MSFSAALTDLEKVARLERSGRCLLSIADTLLLFMRIPLRSVGRDDAPLASGLLALLLRGRRERTQNVSGNFERLASREQQCAEAEQHNFHGSSPFTESINACASAVLPARMSACAV